jgi:hypothetical protein
VKTISTLAALIFVLVASASATAQERTLVLLTEVDVAADGSSTESFWWSGASAPKWTFTDESVRKRGASFEPTGLQRISRIYRRPRLSDANAAALAELFGATTALVGEVRREPLPVSPLGDAVVRVTVDARLVQPDAGGVVVKQVYGLQRLAKGDSAVAERLATEQAAASLMNLVDATLERKVAPVGVVTRETAIALHGIPGLAAWREIEGRLAQRDGVDDVSLAWLAEGIVAVEVNTATEENDATIRRIARDLQNEVFAEFELVAAPESESEGTVALRVRPVRNQ